MRFLSVSANIRHVAHACSALHRNIPGRRHLTSSACCAASTPPGTNGNESEVGDNKGWKYPIFSSDRLRERKSVFLAHASTLPNPSDVSDFVNHLTSLPALKRATHCMYAYRVIPDHTNTSNKIIGQHDGGERGGGERLSRLLDALECENVMVVVSRWYGGVPLGSDRWKMISTVAKEALKKGGFVKERTRDDTTLSNKRNSNKNKNKR